jgi:deoxycytidine triphosphate deaminase
MKNLTEKIIRKFPGLIDPEKEKNQADPWIIALAIEKNEDNTIFDQNKEYCIVSREKIKSSTKIPAVCRAFDVPHLSFEEFLDDNGWRFGIIKA